MKLSKDLKRYVMNRILKRVIPFVILVVVLNVVLVLWGNVIFKTDNKIFQCSCYVLTMLLPFAVTGVPFKLIDRTYLGTIIKVDVATVLDSKSATKVTREMLYTKNIIFLTILLDNGKQIKTKVYEGEAKLEQYINTYKEGDRVFHLYGTKTTIVLPEDSDTHFQCSVCGASNDTSEKICRICSHTLIK